MKFFRRHKYLVDWKLQVTLLLISIGYILFFIAILVAVLFLPLVVRLNSGGETAWQGYEAASQVLFLHKRLWIAFIPGLLAIAIHSIATSHRIAGPLYRFRQVMASMRDGTIPKSARLRKGDFLQREMKAINEMLESLCLRLSDINKAEASLSECIKDCVQKPGDRQELISRLDQIKQRSDNLAEKISHLKYEA